MSTNDNFAALLKEKMGLDPVSVGSTTIQSAVRLRMAALGCMDAEQYWDVLVQSEGELQELIEAVVVPETWFFREQEAFAALVRLVTQEWLPQHPASKLRLLSVPCCTGEEPFSAAMALIDAGISAERLEVDAVDISVRALQRARRGIYGANSFRGDQLTFRDCYFQKIDKDYRLRESLRGIVTFRQENLLSPDFGADAAPYDVIFCRNLLIYFDQDTQRRVLKTLAGLLTPAGFLFVGPAEAFLTAASGFLSANQSMSFAFRKSDFAQHELAVIARPKLPPAAPKPAVKQSRTPSRAPAQTPPVAATDVLPPDCFVEAKRLADAGRLAEAGELCEAQLRLHGPRVELYYLLGLVRDSLGDSEGAAQCYRKALYLDPNHHETMVHLALVSERLGDKAAAQTLFERARRAAANAGA